MTEIDPETGKYLAAKSIEMIDRQVNTYREKRSVASTIIGLNTLLVPFFLAGLSDSLMWIKWLAILPIVGIVFALFFLLKVYYVHPLDQGLAISKYEETIRKPFNEAILMEIGVNHDSFVNNRTVLSNINTAYERGLNLTKIAIALSIVVLSINLYFRPSPEPQMVRIINLDSMSTPENDNKPTVQPTSPAPQPANPPAPKPDKIIPSTNPSDRETFSEGVETEKK